MKKRIAFFFSLLLLLSAAVFHGNLTDSEETLSSAFETDPVEADLAQEAEEYLLGLGLTAQEITAMKSNLS